jgi:hypothetical protein
MSISLQYHASRTEFEVDELERMNRREQAPARLRKVHLEFSDPSDDEDMRRDRHGSIGYWCRYGVRPLNRDEGKQDSEVNVRKIAKETVAEMSEDIARDVAQKHSIKDAVDVARQIAADAAGQIAHDVAQRVATDVAMQTAQDVASSVAIRKAREVSELIARDATRDEMAIAARASAKAWAYYLAQYAIDQERRRRRRRRGSR